MAEKQYFEEDHPTIQLRVWVLGQMVWGAFIAGLVLTAFIAVMVLTWIVGEFLPEESKQAPSPYSALQIVQTVSAV